MTETQSPLLVSALIITRKNSTGEIIKRVVYERIVEDEKCKENQKLKDFIQYYRNNPIKFVEDFYGIEIGKFQRLWLRVLMQIKNKEVRR